MDPSDRRSAKAMGADGRQQRIDEIHDPNNDLIETPSSSAAALRLSSASPSQRGVTSDEASSSFATSSTVPTLRFSHHQPPVASPLRTSIQPQISSSDSNETTPMASPSSSIDVSNPERYRFTDMVAPPTLQRVWSNLEQYTMENAGSGSITPTSYTLPLHHNSYQKPTTSTIEQRRHSDTEHLAVRMTNIAPSSNRSTATGPDSSAQRPQSRLAPSSNFDNAENRRNDVAATGLLNPSYFSSNGAVATGVGGYTSSVDADYYSLPPSRLISRTPTPVMNATSTVSSSTGTSLLNGHRPSSPEFANSTATDSDEADDSDYLGAPGWKSAREVASMFGFRSKRPSNRRLVGKRYQALETKKGSTKWQNSPDTPIMESQRNNRGKDRSKAFEMSMGGSDHDSTGLLNQRVSRSGRRKKQSSPSRIPWPFRVVSSLLFKTFRTLFGPIHPLTIMVALALIAGFVTLVTMLIIYILNPDKEPLPWRTSCQQQMPFPHAYADALAPINVLVGVVTTDSKYERRNIIRQTYARHSLPTDVNGNPTANVQVKFVLGKVRKSHARRVALEMEAFNDIVVLDLEETQSARKTHAFLKWAAENATVPMLRPVGSDWSNVDTIVTDANLPGGLSDWHDDEKVPDAGSQRYQLGWKKVDYVVKADDDSYIVLDELERHLRVAPRQMTYWGYLIKNWFMGGEAYALSFDLVEWIAHSSEVARSAKGKEDTRTPQWIALHPNRSSINWVSEHCWIYDHPKGGSPYSHGFLFPDYVEKIKLEARYGLSEQEIAYRGGERASQSYSTVTKWHQKYLSPRRDLTIEEEVEALVEGGGRWAGTWVRSDEGSRGESWIPYEDIVYGSNDARLMPSVTNDKGSSVLAEDIGWEPISGLHVYGSVDNTSVQDAKQQKSLESRDLLADLSGLPGHFKAHLAMAQAAPLEGSSEKASRNVLYRPHMLPRPSHKDGNGDYAQLRSQRYLHRPHGGTVVVHYLKKTEWWLETALALSGKPKLWTNGAGGRAKEWRMGGSPLVRSDGFILPGRGQPLPMAVAPSDPETSSSSTTTKSKAANTKSSSATTTQSKKGDQIIPPAPLRTGRRRSGREAQY
jgi:hypothetical protein